MINKNIREKIEARAYELYEWRKENNVPGSALGDWLDAQAEIFDQRQNNENCPKCGFKLLARYNDKIICLNHKCDWEIETKRKLDEKIPDFAEIKKNWNG